MCGYHAALTALRQVFGARSPLAAEVDMLARGQAPPGEDLRASPAAPG